MTFLAALAFLLAAPQDGARAEQLLQQLDSDSPDERDAAEKALLAAGEAVEPLLAKAATEGKPEVRARCQDLLRRIALDRKHREFWAPVRPLTLAFDDVPLPEALERLSKASGYTVSRGDLPADRRVTCEIKEAMFLRALETLCLSLNTWYRWNDGAVLLGRVRAPHSRTHAGPLGLSAELGRAHEGSGPGLDLRLEWEPGLRVRWYELEILSAADELGGVVTQAPPMQAAGFDHRLAYARAHLLPSEGDPRHTSSEVLDLTELSKGASRLKSLKGRITLFIPEEVRKVRFEKGAKESVDLGTLTATLGEWTQRQGENALWSASLDLDLSRLPPSRHRALFGCLLNARLRFVDADGKSHDTETGGAHSGGAFEAPLQRVGRTVRSTRLPENATIKAMEATLVTDVWELSYPFELKDIGKP